jgi:hypothetical protein
MTSGLRNNDENTAVGKRRYFMLAKAVVLRILQKPWWSSKYGVVLSLLFQRRLERIGLY